MAQALAAGWSSSAAAAAKQKKKEKRKVAEPVLEGIAICWDTRRVFYVALHANDRKVGLPWFELLLMMPMSLRCPISLEY